MSPWGGGGSRTSATVVVWSCEYKRTLSLWVGNNRRREHCLCCNTFGLRNELDISVVHLCIYVAAENATGSSTVAAACHHFLRLVTQTKLFMNQLAPKYTKVVMSHGSEEELRMFWNQNTAAATRWNDCIRDEKDVIGLLSAFCHAMVNHWSLMVI